jgi:excisionase family DNA binding protein
MDAKSKWLTPAEACNYAKIGRTTLYRLCQRGALKPRKLGARTLIAASELDALIEGQSVAKSATETGGAR